jgi:hypothetical protein
MQCIIVKKFEESDHKTIKLLEGIVQRINRYFNIVTDLH